MSEADDNALDAAVALDTGALRIEDIMGEGFGVPDHTATAGEPTPDFTTPARGSRLNPGGRKRKRGRTGAASNASTAGDAATSAVDVKPPPYRAGKYVPALEQLYTYLGMAVMLADPTCATAILESAHKCAVAVDALAKNNIGVRRVLEAIMNTSAMGVVIAAHLPIVLAIGLHHVPAMKALAPMFEQMTEPPAGPSTAFAEEFPTE